MCNSPVKRLNVFLDQNFNVLRVGGRINFATIPYDQKFPIWLPKNCHFTDLVISNIHRLFGHSGRNFTLSKIRERFWIINGNSQVRKVLNQCIICKKKWAKTETQLMAPLPPDRVELFKPCFFFSILVMMLSDRTTSSVHVHK